MKSEVSIGLKFVREYEPMEVGRYLLNEILARLGYYILKTESWQVIESHLPNVHSILRWNKLNSEEYLDLKTFVLSSLQSSHSQLQQDLVALYFRSVFGGGVNKGDKPFFVEIGANDGLFLSNTYLLEDSYDWIGILSEANPVAYSELVKNRPKSLCDSRATDYMSGIRKKFDLATKSEFSSISGLSLHKEKLVGARTIEVTTVNLTDLLIQHNSPRYIDFLSIDTEGNEFDILKGLDFSRYEIGFLAVEGNDNGKQIEKLMLGKGYKRILAEVSLQDQWYTYPNQVTISKGLR